MTMDVRLRQLGVETLTYTVTLGGTRLLAMLAVAIYSRLLLPQNLGLLDVAIALQAALIPFGALGLRTASKLFWFEAEQPEIANTSALLAVLFCSTSIAMVGHVVAPYVSHVLSAEPGDAGVFRLALWTLPFMLVQDYTAGMLRVLQRPRAFAVMMTGSALLQVGLAVLFVSSGHGVDGILLAGLVAQGIFAAFGVNAIRESLTLRVSMSILRLMLRYGLPLVPAEVIKWLMNSANRLVFAVAGLLAAAGVFGIGLRAAVIVLVVVQAFEQGWMPFALSMAQRDDAPVYYANGIQLYVMLAGTAASFVGIFAGELSWLLAPPIYTGAESIAVIVAYAYAAGGLVFVLGIGAYVNRQTWRISYATGIGAVVSIILSIVLVPAAGGLGAAWSMLLGQLVLVGALVRLTRSIYPLPISWDRISLIVLASCLSTLVGQANWLDHSHPGVSILIKTGWCVIVLVFMWRVGNRLWRDWSGGQA